MDKKTSYRFRRFLATILGLVIFGVFLLVNPNSYQPEYALNDSVQTPEEISTKDETTSDSTLAVDVLESLAVHGKNTTQKYYRKLFYSTWGSTDSGCNTREAILARDLKDIIFDGCKVQSGVLNDPYTGQEIQFERGQNTSSAVQIDHVVALSNAWATGAYMLDEDTRYKISQDPLNLIAVDGPANQEKSDQDASEWLPDNLKFQCQYVARQISVKAKYHLWVTPAEKSAMQSVLATCPNEPTIGLENR